VIGWEGREGRGDGGWDWDWGLGDGTLGAMRNRGEVVWVERGEEGEGRGKEGWGHVSVVMRC
jgi:hypothetical protein